jgi:predicted transcriptional regulator of viral defense system
MSGPQWDELYAAAATQEGLFSTEQAAAAGYSLPLLAKYLRNGRVARVRRGIYRLVHFPAGEHEDLVMVWLWTEKHGVFSHETALTLLELSDVLPHHVHVTLPAAWADRRLRVPEGVVLHHSDVRVGERAWVGPVPVTTPVRTITDCVATHVSPEIVEKAVRDALRRGLATKNEMASARAKGRAEAR